MSRLHSSDGDLATFVILAAWGALVFTLAHRAERALGRRQNAVMTTACPTALGIALLASFGPSHERALTLGVVAIALVAAAPADIRTGLIFDAVTAPTAVVVIFLSALLGRAELAAVGVATVASFFFAIVTISRGAWMGMGDVKAIFAIAAAFGPIESVLTILVACLSGIAIAVLRPAPRTGRALPFGPHLAFGACAVLAGGPGVEQWMHLA